LNGYSAESTAAFARRLSEAAASLPGVRSVTAAELSTLTDMTMGSNVKVEGAAEATEELRIERNGIGPDYFATLGIPIVAGRGFAWTDSAAAPKVAIVNETMARRFLPGRSPLGARFAIGAGKDVRPDIEIVGVVRDSKAAKVTEKPAPFAYLPYLQNPRLGRLTFYVRSDRDPSLLVAPVRGEVRRLDAELPIADVKLLRTQIDESLLPERFLTILSAAFGGLAALLAAIGIYGVLAFSVAQRRQEIGVRMALGADPSSVRGLILSEVARFLAIGAAIGLPAAWALGRTIESILYGVRASDPAIFAVSAATLAAVSIAAAWPSARRASRTNPMDALRGE
ncbi:MAG TPA: FtsX-like permease family protein, partial [Thermoanaerobaculia bacterium]|nr:FtsX-like permease family protein [Thermoanaerobaculia bacterium]